MNQAPKHIYFLGAAGIGVSALAQVAQARGARISGADPQADAPDNPAVSRLRAGGATLYTRHEAPNLAGDVDLVVASAAVPDHVPEIQEARCRGVRVVSRADFLGELMDAHRGVKIAVAGTHGKTTTTAMLGVMLQHAGLDPTVFVGGEVPQLGGNVRIGSPDGPFVAEACEAYDSFLSLKPDIAVITNIEPDHLDHYGSFDHLLDHFRRFVRNVRSDIVVCRDDPGIDRISGDIADHLPCMTYSLGPHSGVWAGSLVLNQGTSFDWMMGESTLGHIDLSVPGRHNVLNALAVCTVAASLNHRNKGIRHDRVVEGLSSFTGVTRRQEVLGEANGILVMDDYAHHPTEIAATLSALRTAHPQRRLIVIFQPHLYSRTRDFLAGFAETLAKADAVFVTAIYAAREQPIPGVDAADIVAKVAMSHPGIPARFARDRNEIPMMLEALARPGDLTVFVGAGDIREQGEQFLQRLKEEATRP